MGKQLSNESRGKSSNNVKDKVIKSTKVKQIRKVKGERKKI